MLVYFENFAFAKGQELIRYQHRCFFEDYLAIHVHISSIKLKQEICEISITEYTPAIARCRVQK